MSDAAVILAAGKGTRMKSQLPKVLHPIAGQPMLRHVIDVVKAQGADPVAVVIGADMAVVAEAASDVRTCVQDPPLGTGHAVMAAREIVDGCDGTVFVLFGDTPLVREKTLATMKRAREDGNTVVVLGFRPDDAAAYGRLIVDDAGDLTGIVEFKDATDTQKKINFCNSGVMAVDGRHLFKLLDRLDNNNAQGEYYLPDIISLARQAGLRCKAIEAQDDEWIGVDSRAGLARAEALWQDRARSNAMANGVTLIDPSTVYFSYDTKLGQDILVGQHVVFGPGVTVGDGVEIKPFCHLEETTVARDAIIGPYSRLRPGAEIGPSAHIGNFVEIKNAVVEEGAKVNHLTYIGDAFIGARSNIGAGTITCNYDGFNKYLTVIEEDVFVGSNTSLVAPVRVAKGANTAAGTVVSKNVKSDALTITRADEREISGWAPRYRARKSKEKADGKWPKPDPRSVKS